MKLDEVINLIFGVAQVFECAGNHPKREEGRLQSADRFHGDGPSLEAQFSSVTGDNPVFPLSCLSSAFLSAQEGATARPWVQRSCGLVAARV